MSKQIVLDFEDQIFEQANDVFESIGLDFRSATNMFLKKVIKDGSISFLFSQQTISSSQKVVDNEFLPPLDKGDMTKNKAIRLFSSKGYSFGKNVTFASKNRGAYNYWANVEFGILANDWHLILNDWINKVVYLFYIPANSINAKELTPRSDKPYLVDLQIMYNDTTFTDNRSGYSFNKFLVETINY